MMHSPQHPRTQMGFTLIELMIVVAIVAILATIAYPSYQEQVRRANRAEAKGFLLEDAHFLERIYTANNCYHRDDGACGSAANVTLLRTQSPPGTGAPKYNITVDWSGCTLGQCFTLSAAPTGSQTGDACGTLTLAQTGVRGQGDYDGDGTTGAVDADDVAACWQR